MALYKDESALEETNDHVFDAKYAPGTAAAYAGIYGCVGCGREIAAAEGAMLPESGHHAHDHSQGDHAWRLLVNADAEPKKHAGWMEKASHKSCAHPACNCEAAGGGRFCSEYCRDAGKTLELACNCGHAGCGAELTHRS